MFSGWVHRWVIASGLLLAGLGEFRAVADEAEQLGRIHKGLVRPERLNSAERGRKGRDLLDGLGINLSSLSAAGKVRFLQAHLFASLAIGDAADALGRLEDLGRLDPNAELTRVSMYLTGCSSGDAQMVTLALEKAKRVGEEQALLERRGAGVPRMGKQVPFSDLIVANLPEIAEGKVIVLDFWRSDDRDQRLFDRARGVVGESYAEVDAVTLLGICLDDDAARGKPRAASREPAWRTLFVSDSGVQTLREAFGIKQTPAQLVIDQYGFVRCGTGFDDPAWHYALRAAVAEQAGTYPPMKVRLPSGARVKTRADREAERELKEQFDREAAYPHSPEAAKLLDRARLYIRTGRKTDARKLLREILEKYPETQEALEAADRLRLLGG